jgi:undecaprenyl-diphosphatase
LVTEAYQILQAPDDRAQTAPASRRLPLRHAVALGLVQGPAELLPISSSGHVVLLPAILGWPYDRLDPGDRKAFEVALHVGTAAGLLIALRREVLEVARALDPGRVLRLAVETVPPTCAGLFLHRPIVERLSAPRRVAVAQIAAGAALLAADLRPTDRRHEEAPLLDAIAVGLAQATALAPGVSRGGAALTVLRLRRLDRRSASVVSRHAAAPIVLGAAVLEGVRLARRPLPAALVPPFAAGVVAALASTIAARRLATTMDRARTYAPLAAYRVALGAAALRRFRSQPSGTRARSGLRPGRALEWLS